MGVSEPQLKYEHGERRRSPAGGQPQIVARLDRIRSEYLEMPGLSLTQEQAQRLWGLGPTECRALLEALSQAGFLRRTPAGAYVRRSTAA
jgi:DNA-binding GntR family transcriptional regulator